MTVTLALLLALHSPPGITRTVLECSFYGDLNLGFYSDKGEILGERSLRESPGHPVYYNIGSIYGSGSVLLTKRNRMFLYHKGLRSVPFHTGSFVGNDGWRPILADGSRLFMFTGKEWMPHPLQGRKGFELELVTPLRPGFFLYVFSGDGGSTVFTGSYGKPSKKICTVARNLSKGGMTPGPVFPFGQDAVAVTFGSSEASSLIVSVNRATGAVRTLYEGPSTRSQCPYQGGLILGVGLGANQSVLQRLSPDGKITTLGRFSFEFEPIVALSKRYVLGFKVRNHFGCYIKVLDVQTGRLGDVSEGQECAAVCE